MYYLPYLNLFLAIGGLALGVVVIALFVDLFLCKGKYFSKVVLQFFWPVTIITGAGSVVLSLVYSEYYGFIPCSLCWLQRIAIYPQALLSMMAAKMNDRFHFPIYGIGLSVFGLLVALYQYVYQMMPKSESGGIMPCLADGSADCADKVIDVFGFVTFPFLSLVTFAFLIALYLYVLRDYKLRNSAQ